MYSKEKKTLFIDAIKRKYDLKFNWIEKNGVWKWLHTGFPELRSIAEGNILQPKENRLYRKAAV